VPAERHKLSAEGIRQIMTIAIRRAFPVLITSAVLLCACGMKAQSLAEVARHSRRHSTASEHVFTNDNLPTDGTISIIGSATPDVPAESAAGTSQASPSAPANANAANPEGANAASDGQASSDSKESTTAAPDKAELQKDAAELKQQVSMLERELDVSNREFRLRAATYYADAGNSLRNPKQWADQQRDHEKEVQDKQAALDTAKQKLADVQEQARRQGIAVE
jgi:hypothetical protein